MNIYKYLSTTVDTGHHTFVQTYGMYKPTECTNPRVNTTIKLWTLGDNNVLMQVHQL